MAQFSQILVEYIQKRNLNYTKLSKLSGVDRTLIHHMVQEKRKPTIPVTQQLADALALSPEERTEFLRLSEIAYVGERTYVSRQAVEKLLTNISVLRPWEFGGTSSEAITETGPVVYQGAADIHVLLKRLVDQEAALPDGFIDYLGQPNHEFLLRQLAIASAGTALRIRHIFSLINDPDAVVNNLACFGQLLSTLLTVKNYSAYYYYSATSISGNPIAPFPTLLVTSRYAVQLNSTFTTAILHTGQVHSVLRQHFQSSLRLSQSLHNSLNSILEFSVLPAEVSAPHYKQNTFFSLIADFCCVPFLTREMVAAHIRPVVGLDDCEQMTEFIFKLCQDSITSIRKYPATEYLTKAGVKRFLDSGCFCECADEFYHPFEPKGRAFILRQAIKEVEENELYQLRLYDQDVLPFSDVISFQVNTEGNDLILNCKHPTLGFSSLTVREPTIVPAISDYLSNLLHHPAVSSQEDSLAWLKSTLADFCRQYNL